MLETPQRSYSKITIIKNTDLFSDFENTAIYPSPAPSSATFAPTFVPSYYPSSVDETVEVPLNSATPTPATSLSSTSAGWKINSNLLAAVSVSTVIFVTFAALIFFRRHIREKSLWNISNQHKFASEEEGPSEKISFFNDKWFTSKVISSLLTASTSNTRSAMIESPRTVIQSFWDSDEESISEFGPDLKIIKPSIIKVESTKAVEHDIGEDLINFEDFESILSSSDISVTELIDSYPSYTNVIIDFDLEYANLDADFEPDTSWNFEDNEPTLETDVDPFDTPVYPNQDTIGNFYKFLI